MAKYRKKPVVIEAEQWTGFNLNDDNSLFQSPAVIIRQDGNEFLVGTLEGAMTGQKGDWLIKGVKGELYPCKPDIFEATYEPADHPSKMICLDGFRTLEEFKNGLKSMRPDWFRSTDCVGTDACKVTTETVKPE